MSWNALHPATLGVGDVAEPLLSAYLAYIPSLLFTIGLVFVLADAMIVHQHRRLTIIGLWMTAVSALWIMLRMIYPAT